MPLNHMNPINPGFYYPPEAYGQTGQQQAYQQMYQNQFYNKNVSSIVN
jgi:hypothetical protein